MQFLTRRMMFIAQKIVTLGRLSFLLGDALKLCIMKKTATPSIRLRQGWLALAIALALVVMVKIFIFPLFSPMPTPETASTSAAEQREIMAFEQQRVRDSLARVAQWAAERKARQWAREERERAYQAQRAIWDAEKAERAARRAAQQARYDSLLRSRPQKLAKGTRIDANASDTTQWQRVPGVGRAYAQAIVRYRERLGGFVSVAQLHDIEQLPHDIDRYISLAPHPSVHRIAVNRASFKELLRHPYLNYDQVKAIVQHRQRVGPLRDWDDLRGNPQFSDADLQRLQPYFSF